MWRWIVATVAPKRIGPTPWPASTASRGPPGTGQLVRAAGAVKAGGAADAAAVLAAALALGAPPEELAPLLHAASKTAAIDATRNRANRLEDPQAGEKRRSMAFL